MKSFSIILCLLGFSLNLVSQKAFPLQSQHSVSQEWVDIKVKTMEGEYLPLKDVLKDDKNYVLSIMATWCGPCRLELDQFEKEHKRWSSDLSTEVIAISIDKPADTQKLFDMAKKMNWSMQVVHDDMGYTARELKVFGIPQTILINKKKEIVYSSKGYKPNLNSIYEKEIKKLQ